MATVHAAVSRRCVTTHTSLEKRLCTVTDTIYSIGMEPAWAVLWLFLALLTSTTRCYVGAFTNGTSITFKVINARNSASQWSTEVKFDNNKNARNKWKIQIDQIDTFQCAGTIEFTATMNVPAPRDIPGYTYMPGLGYYKMHDPGQNWEGARRTCVREGGHLAIVNSEHEASMLQLMFNKTSSQKVFAFIGFHDHYHEGEYLTIYDVPLAQAGFTRWAPTQPDNVGYGGENCGSIYRGDGGLNDIDCGFDDWPFICEQEL